MTFGRSPSTNSTAQANQVANALEARGIGTGDTVGLYMPMVPEVISILYGCFKVGAIAVPIFSGFGVDATATRIADAECSVLFTGDGFYRRGSEVRSEGDRRRGHRAGGPRRAHHRLRPTGTRAGRGIDRRDPVERTRRVVGRGGPKQDDEYETKALDSSDESMLLYSSGTTGKPKGIVHTHAGTLMQCAKEIYFGFDHKDRGPLLLGLRYRLDDGAVDAHRQPRLRRHGLHVRGRARPPRTRPILGDDRPPRPDPVFGISPTAIRALRKKGDEWVEGYDLSTLRLLGSTGEPWDPESWLWFYENVGGTAKRPSSTSRAAPKSVAVS